MQESSRAAPQSPVAVGVQAHTGAAAVRNLSATSRIGAARDASTFHHVVATAVLGASSDTRAAGPDAVHGDTRTGLDRGGISSHRDTLQPFHVSATGAGDATAVPPRGIAAPSTQPAAGDIASARTAAADDADEERDTTVSQPDLVAPPPEAICTDGNTGVHPAPTWIVDVPAAVDGAAFLPRRRPVVRPESIADIVLPQQAPSATASPAPLTPTTGIGRHVPTSLATTPHTHGTEPTVAAGAAHPRAVALEAVDTRTGRAGVTAPATDASSFAPTFTVGSRSSSADASATTLTPTVTAAPAPVVTSVDDSPAAPQWVPPGTPSGAIVAVAGTKAPVGRPGVTIVAAAALGGGTRQTGSDTETARRSGATSATAATTASVLATPAQSSPAATSAGAIVPGSGADAGPAEQISHVLIGLPSAGSHRVTVQLAPTELGRVQISIERSADGTAVVTVTAERPETLTLVQGDSAQLHAALDRAGVSGHGRTLHFTLAGGGAIEMTGGDPVRTGAEMTASSNPADGSRMDRSDGTVAANQTGGFAEAQGRTREGDAAASLSAGTQAAAEPSSNGRGGAEHRTGDQGANANASRHPQTGGAAVPAAGSFVTADTPGIRGLGARARVDITA